MCSVQTPYEDIIIPLEMSSLSVKARHLTDPPLKMSPSTRHKVVTPMHTLDMTRAKTVNNVEEQQLKKKLEELERQQNKMRSEMLQMKASLVPEIMVTSAWGPGGKNSYQIAQDANGHHDALNKDDVLRTRKRSGSLPPLITSQETEKARLGGSSNQPQKGLITPTPPTKPIHRARSMNEIDRGRPRARPKSAYSVDTASTSEARRRSFQASKSANTSVESLPSELSSKTDSYPSMLCTSNEDSTSKPRTKSTSALLPLRKAKSTSNLSGLTKVRRATVDTADLTKLDKDSIFRNRSYNPVLLNPSLPPGPSTTNGSRRRKSSPLRLNQLCSASAPVPPDRDLPSLQDQFEQLRTCRYLRIPSDESDQ